jgi:hypothetical protein
MIRWAGVGVSIRSSGCPRYASISARSGRRRDSIRCVVRKPSWATTPGLRLSSAIRCAMMFRSAADCASRAKSWKKPVSSMQW